MGGFVFEIAFDPRRGADQPNFAACRDACCRFLHASRLAQDDRDDRWACAAAPPRDGAGTRPRDRYRHGRVYARPSPCMSLSWRLVWHWTFADRAQFRPLDRHHGRDLELHPLCRLLDRPRPVLDGCDRAGLAAMEIVSHVAWRRFDRSIS